MNRMWYGLCFLLQCSLSVFRYAVDAQQLNIYGKYYEGSGKDFTDNSYYLYSPPGKHYEKSTTGITPHVKVPVVVQLGGSAWLKGPYSIPFKKETPAITEYNSKGIAFVSMGYRAIDRHYWYDAPGATPERKMEELIHVDPEGKFSLDTTGKTMADYQVRFCFLELVTKAMYDATQGLEPLINHADRHGIDVHRIVFFSSSAGSSQVNYLTWVYHSMNMDRFTPVGMLLINPQLDLPMYCWTKPVWEYWLTHSSVQKVNQLMNKGMCSWFVMNDGWRLGHTAAHENISEVPERELYNETWEGEQYSTCGTGFDDLTIAKIASMRDIDVSPGLRKLWLTSANMLHHKSCRRSSEPVQILPGSPKPKAFHLYIVSGGPDTCLLHSGLWGLAYAEHAKRAGIDYTVYYEDFPGMKASTLGQTEIRHQDAQKYNYHSSSTWHAEVVKQDKALHPAGWKAAPFTPNSLTEHVAFACYVTGLSCPLPAQPDSWGAEADIARGSASTRLFDGTISNQTQPPALGLNKSCMLALVLACLAALAVALHVASHATKKCSSRRLITRLSDVELVESGAE